MENKVWVVEAGLVAVPEVCVVYRGEVDSTGYGRVWTGSVKMQAHRYALMMHDGLVEPPAGLDAAHDPVLCSDRRCVNPFHLRWATRSENLGDRWAAGTVGGGGGVPVVRRYDCEIIRCRVLGGDVLEDLVLEFGVSAEELGKCLGQVF